MIIKYISFITGIIWSYSIIRTQSVFSKKAGLIFKLFISKVSWLTLISACYFGYKNFDNIIFQSNILIQEPFLDLMNTLLFFQLFFFAPEDK